MKSGESLTNKLNRSATWHRLSVIAVAATALSVPATAYAKNIWGVDSVAMPDGRMSLIAFGTADVEEPQDSAPVYGSNQEKLVAILQSAELLPWCTVTKVEGVVVTDGVKIQDQSGTTYPLCADESTIKLGRSDVVTANLRTEPTVEQTVGNVSIYKSFDEDPTACIEAKQQIETVFYESVIAFMGVHYAEELKLQITVDQRAPLRECGE